jgi:hypothetical protein
MIPSTPCWLALHVALPVLYIDASDLKKPRNKKVRRKKRGITIWLTQPPNPRELETNNPPKAVKPGIMCLWDAKIAAASSPPDLPHFWR